LHYQKKKKKCFGLIHIGLNIFTFCIILLTIWLIDGSDGYLSLNLIIDGLDEHYVGNLGLNKNRFHRTCAIIMNQIAEANQILNMIMIGSMTCLIYQGY